MKRSLMLATSIAATLIATSPACAWDPDLDVGPADPEPGNVSTPRSEPAAAPDGVYLVTETYVDDVVTHAGAVTTYATETAHEITGSYAKVLESVATGARSGYDGAAFNGRAALTDGRSVAGTYYENYIRTDSGYIPVSVVFFQDDLEIARATRSIPPASRPAADPYVAPQPVTPSPDGQAIGAVTPIVEGNDGSRASRGEREAAVPNGPPGQAVVAALPDRAIEVLRARRIAIAFADPGVVRWRFVGGEAVVLGAAGGDGGERFFARWDRLAPVGGAWLVRFVVSFSDGTTRDLALRVTVRAPGLVE